MIRRFFIVMLSVQFAAGAACLGAAPAAKEASRPNTPPPERLMGMLKPGHPRLLIDRAGFEEMGRRTKTDATLARWDKRLRNDADRIVAGRCLAMRSPTASAYWPPAAACWSTPIRWP